GSVDAKRSAISFSRGSLKSRMGSPLHSAQQIRNVDLHGTGRAVGLARHAVPAFVVFHVGLSGALVDPENVQRADVDTHAAAFVGNAFFLVDDDGDAGGGRGDRHGGLL